MKISKQKRILIVDDDVNFKKFMYNLLGSAGYRILLAEDEKGAFEKAVNKKPDLIILDIMLNRATEGFDILRKLKRYKETKNIPVIFLTGIKRDIDLLNNIKLDKAWTQVECVLEKSVDPDQILEAVEKTIEGSKNKCLTRVSHIKPLHML